MASKVLEPAFQGVGQKVYPYSFSNLGIEIWKIHNSQPVPLPESDYGRFHSGDSYIILKTAGKAGAYTYNIHFWLGIDTSQDEAVIAAGKAVELDAILGSRAIQYRELQSYESTKFLSYFKPFIMPQERGVPTGDEKPEEEESYETRLYTCQGKRVVRLKQVPFTRSTLNHDEVFILDTKDKIFQFNGANTNIQERTRALDIVQLFKEKYHEGTCNVAIVDDGKLQSEGHSGEFWELFGGFAPIGKKVPNEDDIIPEKTPAKLYCIFGGQLQEVVGELSKSSLRTDKCYILYCCSELFVWVGRTTRLDDKKASVQIVEEFIVTENVPKLTRVTRISQGHETNSFKSNFASWPSASAAPAFEEGRGKVAAMLKQQGSLLKGQTKSSPVEEEVPPFLGENGNIEVWRVDGEDKTEVPTEDIGKFYSGDCYICLYSYHSNEKREDHYLCCWIGKDSIEEDQTKATQLATSIFNSLKCKAVQGRIYQGKEPPQFVAIFQPMVVLKGGLSSGYKNYIAEKELNDETYTPDTAALIEICGTSAHNKKALQVDVAATSLNSYGCFILQSASSVLTWSGNQSTVEQQKLAAKVIELLKPGVPVKFAREGKESLAFWLALGGKQDYTSKKLTQEFVREPHLFAIQSNKGKFEIEEVYSFEQDDLLTEDVMILDTHAEVIVWVGQSVDPKEKQNALETGQKYIDVAATAEGLCPHVPLYRVPEGSEPSFFTTYFSWDHAKTTVQGNSFKKKAMQLFGPGCTTESQDNKPQGNKSSGATQRASAMAALTSAFNSSPVTKAPIAPRIFARGSQRAAAVAALSAVLTAEKKAPPTSEPGSPRRHSRTNTSSEPVSPVASAASRIFGKSPVKNEEPSDVISASPVKNEEPSDVISESPVKNEEPSNTIDNSEVSEVADETSEPNVETNEEDSSTKEADENENSGKEIQSSYTYDQLRAKSDNPVTGIDFKKRESYLSPEEFEEIFKITKEAFYNFPRWKQDQIKKKVDLF
ncbi:villin headpiece, Villin/Gelsolin, ADF-H/Gelsolin-like domain protein [Artemisia annua]|uniref:Villin headpiece, Villin/Gelsolin, ADF-H/Gelsolin-like domain protein n=1 Tax=Artemisia annua TaxID=35608 RepID=A0A2U1QMG5_ARTAN|nr:villin headpiece, Villin/Gelsolin, ADF-H/Gelsolin-like domain protein [Artemisia annua]